MTGAGTGTVAIPMGVLTPTASPSQQDSLAPAPSLRLRPEVPNFDFGARKSNETGRCTRCGCSIEHKLAFCPQCGASLTESSSPIADATHNSIPPDEASRARLVVAGASPTALAQDRSNATTCSGCGVSVLSGARNCPQCGTPIEAQGPSALSPEVSAEKTPTGPAERIATARPPVINSDPAAGHLGDSPKLSRRLVMLAQDGSVQRVIPLAGDRIDLGRIEGEIQLPDDSFLSARHARFAGREGAFTLTDLASLNGIYLKLREVASLSDGDMFLLGLQLLEFRTEPAEMTQLVPIQAGGCSLFGSSTSPRYARLCERTSDGAPRSVFAIGRDETILGREVGDIVFSGDPFMSRRHAVLTRDPTDGTFTLRDLGSSNGTFLRVRGKVDLKPGDHLRIGQHLFRYEMETP